MPGSGREPVKWKLLKKKTAEKLLLIIKNISNKCRQKSITSNIKTFWFLENVWESDLKERREPLSPLWHLCWIEEIRNLFFSFLSFKNYLIWPCTHEAWRESYVRLLMPFSSNRMRVTASFSIIVKVVNVQHLTVCIFDLIKNLVLLLEALLC